MILIYKLLGLIFPRKCLLCRRILRDEETDLCGPCRINAPYFPDNYRENHRNQKLTLHFLDSFTAVWYYEGTVRKAVHRFKFGRKTHLFPGFGRMMAMRIAREYAGQYDLITWVPVSFARRWKRGYDQSERLCRAVGRELNVKPQRTLRKIRNNAPQSSLERAQRKANVLGVYRPVHPEAIRGKRVLLIDDVITTGATADECAAVLSVCGAKAVHLVTVAAAVKKDN